MRDVRPIGVLSDAQAMRIAAGCGARAWGVVLALRDHGGVRTLGEIWEDVGVPIDALTESLSRLEDAGLIQRRDMLTDAGSQPVWWAPRVVIAGRAIEAMEDKR